MLMRNGQHAAVFSERLIEDSVLINTFQHLPGLGILTDIVALIPISTFPILHDKPMQAENHIPNYYLSLNSSHLSVANEQWKSLDVIPISSQMK